MEDMESDIKQLKLHIEFSKTKSFSAQEKVKSLYECAQEKARLRAEEEARIKAEKIYSFYNDTDMCKCGNGYYSESVKKKDGLYHCTECDKKY